jgi:hypothetical protein
MISDYGDDHLVGQFRGSLGIQSLENINEVLLGHLRRNEILEGENFEQASLQIAKIGKMLGQGEHLLTAEFDVPLLTGGSDKLKTDIEVRPPEGDYEPPPKA